MSPRGTNLYRKGGRAVILAALGLMLAQFAPAQVAGRKGPPKGPRAMGLLELSPNGKAHLIPITILYDGEFYDASAYKAAPVPMALESGTVYEAVRTGVSQGLFTVSSALQGNNTWIGEGTWQSASALAAAASAAAKKKEAQSKKAPEPIEGPPVLRRAGSPKPPEPAQSAPAAGSNPAPPQAAPASSAPAPAPVASAPPVRAAEEDPDRPVLKRGIPSPAEQKKPSSAAAVPSRGDGKKPVASAPSASGSNQFIPAISDGDGPDPRPYTDDLKPEEEEKLRKKILALAAAAVRARAAQLAAGAAAQTSSRPATQAKPPQPSFEEVQLRVFDLSNSNEPVLVLTTKARMPTRPNTAGDDLQYIVTLVAREDIYGDLHKAFANVTDTLHLDVLPRMELIDAVDADGDGRGELLFRQISDAGRAFVLYRVIGDRLWPLFRGTPGP
ncbi:MAG TPA: hypothetical protein VK513_10295 [Terriglobales bacterium]|nr:hypothetical protein [Terriglobales bacterium]